MRRPITIFSGQWSDLSFDEACSIFSSIGYEGVEISCRGRHLDPVRAVKEPAYVKEHKDILEKYNLKCFAISDHFTGHCVGSDEQLESFVPENLIGKPTEIRAWAVEKMKYVAHTAAAMGVDVVTGFMGSPIWKYFYSGKTKERVEAGYDLIVEVWSGIFDVFDELGIKFALEPYPTQIAYDYYTTQKLLEKFNRRPTLGLNFDPSHLIWNMVDPVMFVHDFADRIYHVHIKDTKLNYNGRNSVLNSHLSSSSDTRRGWTFVSPGRGDVDFEALIREFDHIGYYGPLSIEWEDWGMDRVFGATEAYEFTKKINFPPSARNM
ncbi:MAG: sugar phosphate isomerase/epimerase [Oscillospiraceae bacterium]|nr:sugar phosphate isomerase/epimerase [Oscillospiraceae bacterium]